MYRDTVKLLYLSNTGDVLFYVKENCNCQHINGEIQANVIFFFLKRCQRIKISGYKSFGSVEAFVRFLMI